MDAIKVPAQHKLIGESDVDAVKRAERGIEKRTGLDGKALGLMYGFIANQEVAVIKAESHPGARWELADGTRFIFDAFGEGEDAEVTATVTFNLKRDGEKLNWSIEIDQK